MKDSIILFLFLIPTFLFAQYPTGSNKARLGWQTTGDGLIWRGVAGDTVNKPNNRNYPYFQLDTVNAVLYRFIQTKQQWQPVSESVNIDSLIYATRFWVNSNFFPLQGGTLTGTAGAGFINFPLQSSPPGTPATGFSLYAGSTGNNISWMQPDGFFRRLVSPTTGVARQYQFMARSYTLADSADVAALPTGSGTTNYYTKWSSSTALGIGNLFDNNTVVSILNNKPFSLGQWTTAGQPAGTAGYMGFRLSGINGIEWYNGTRWAYALESTFARGTSTRIPFFDANGQITQLSTLVFQTGDSQLRSNQMQSETVEVTFGGLNTNTTTAISKTASDVLVYGGGNINHMYIGFGGSQTALKVGSDWITMGGRNITNAAAAVLAPNRQAKVGLTGDIVFSPGILTNIGDQPGVEDGADFYIRGGDQNNSGAARTGNRLIIRSGASSGTNRAGGNLTFQGGTSTGTGLGGDIVFQTTPSGASGTTINPFSTSMILKGNGFLGIGTTSPLQDLDVNGDAYIRDSIRLTTTPAHTSIIGLLTRDANGWVGAATLAGLTYDNGALAARRDTAIYVTDADYNFSAAVTSANILKRYSRIIIYSKLTSGASSDNQIILHSASSDFLQCEIIIYSNDASADADATSIDFTTNGAVDGAGGTLSSYAMAPGQRVEIRVADDGGYKWFFN